MEIGKTISGSGDHSGQRFEDAIRRFDEENARDPHSEVQQGIASPRELAHAKRLSEWVRRLCPGASEALLLAARCQHLCRWAIPRDSYEMTRAGYLRWRSELKAFHARRSGEILRELNYSEETILRVQSLNLKKEFPNDPESQVLEDALCLVFLEFQFADLASKTEEAKMIGVLQKTWKKMTRAGREAALGLKYGEREKSLLGKAGLNLA